MQKIRYPFTQLNFALPLLRWMLLSLPVAIITGSLVALFLWLLDVVTVTRWTFNWLLYFLPLAGIAMYFLYKYAGKNAEGGNKLIIDEITEPGEGVPARMAPLVLVSTIITHLFGGSAGREGTAVQMGGSIAALVCRWFRLTKGEVSIILMTGVAAGFGAVFGTPVTGAIFAIEVVGKGTRRFNAVVPCLIASVVADSTCRAWGIQHTFYALNFQRSVLLQFATTYLNFLFATKVVVCGVLFGLVSYLFSIARKGLHTLANRLFAVKWIIPFAGGIIIIALTYVVGTSDYLGLGVVANRPTGVSIVSSFQSGGANDLSWWWKLLFTAVTLATGFKGGEVTPLFFIGSTLGNTLASISGAPVDLFAALGFIAVFAGATKTPLACTIMGVELFGGANVVYYAIACFTSYVFSGKGSIYTTPTQGVSK